MPKLNEIIDNTADGLIQKDYSFWINELNAAAKREEKWRNKSEKYEERFLNERQNNDNLDNDKQRYNIYFSNTEFLKGALLPTIPHLVIERRFAKEQAQNLREKQFYTIVSEIAERAVSYNTVECGFENEIEAFKYDYLICGRAVLWCVFDAEFEELGTDLEGNTIEKVLNEKVLIEHIGYEDFRMSAGKKWKDIWWIARRQLLNRKDLIKRFGDEIGTKIKLEQNKADDESSKSLSTKFAEVWEIWDKSDKKIYFVSKGYEGILDTKDDPYKLKGFYPTPEPLRSIKSNKSMIPTPEFDLYKSEADSLSKCARRIDKLVEAIRASALYPAKFKDAISKINNAHDDEYIAVDISSEINDIGGMEKLFAYNPIEAKQKVALGLYSQQQNLVQTIYEITGISDIMRGIADTKETATATSKKGKFGSLRLQTRQNAINDYVKQVYGIITEIVCELYTIDTLKDIT